VREGTDVIVRELLSSIDACTKRVDELSIHDRLHDDLGIDSLAAIEFMVYLEERFRIVITDDDLLMQEDWMQTVGSVVEFIERKGWEREEGET